MVELQGYVYDAWLRMAEVFDAIGKPARARSLRKKAAALFERFNDAFWDEGLGFYAFCLDGEKKPVLSVASNPGHCLWSGIVPPERAARVVRRLMKPDMWSGWGIRTLSSDHPAYNPYSYQNGSVWPHDNGHDRRSASAATGSSTRPPASPATLAPPPAISCCHQMPELYSGAARDPTNFPVQYLGRQRSPGVGGRSVSSAFCRRSSAFNRTRPNGKLYLDPYLPDWLPELTLRDVRVGRHIFDLRFARDGKATRFEVLKGDAEAIAQYSYATATERWV